MKYPLTWHPNGYHYVTVTERRGGKCDSCSRDSAYLVEVSKPYADKLDHPRCCALHVENYLPSTQLDGEQGEIGTAKLWDGRVVPLRVVLAEFHPDDQRWQVQVLFGSSWESTHTGWYRTRLGALLAYAEKGPFPIVDATPELAELSARYTNLVEAERKAKKDALEAEARRVEEDRRRSDTFWTETEARARAMKGKRGTISLLKYHREDTPAPATREPVREDVKGTIYGDLAIHNENSRFALTHIPTGLAVGTPFPSQIDARMAVYLLRESGVDWGSLTAKLSDDERTIIGTLLRGVEDRQIPEYTKIGAAA